MYRILIVEDDRVIADTLADQLTQWGYQAGVVRDFERVLEQFVREQPHLVLLDISLPFYNGYHWCQEIRKVSNAPIVFLSSAGDNMNIVLAMQMGGDDFIAKPFDLHVLVAKLQALLRRTYAFQAPSNLLEHKGAILDLGGASIQYRGVKVELTKNEFKILQALMENRGRAVSREALMQRLWESDSFVDDNTLTVNLSRLRKKLEEAGLRDYIVTKKGMGYLV